MKTLREYDDKELERIYFNREIGRVQSWPHDIDWKPKTGGGFKFNVCMCDKCQRAYDDNNPNTLLGFKRMCKEFFEYHGHD